MKSSSASTSPKLPLQAANISETIVASEISADSPLATVANALLQLEPTTSSSALELQSPPPHEVIRAIRLRLDALEQNRQATLTNVRRRIISVLEQQRNVKASRDPGILASSLADVEDEVHAAFHPHHHPSQQQQQQEEGGTKEGLQHNKSNHSDSNSTTGTNNGILSHTSRINVENLSKRVDAALGDGGGEGGDDKSGMSMMTTKPTPKHRRGGGFSSTRYGCLRHTIEEIYLGWGRLTVWILLFMTGMLQLRNGTNSSRSGGDIVVVGNTTTTTTTTSTTTTSAANKKHTTNTQGANQDL